MDDFRPAWSPWRPSGKCPLPRDGFSPGKYSPGASGNLIFQKIPSPELRADLILKNKSPAAAGNLNFEKIVFPDLRGDLILENRSPRAAGRLIFEKITFPEPRDDLILKNKVPRPVGRLIFEKIVSPRRRATILGSGELSARSPVLSRFWTAWPAIFFLPVALGSWRSGWKREFGAGRLPDGPATFGGGWMVVVRIL